MADGAGLAGRGDVSVLVAAYNAAETLGRALDSALGQTLPPKEILVIDDGSRDGTAEVARRYADRGVVLLQQRNAGVSAARNAGLREATGSLIAFLDADDWWDRAKLERQVRALRESPDKVATYTGVVIVQQETGEQRVQPPTEVATLWPQLRWTNPFIPPSSVLVRRVALMEAGGFNEALAGGEDWELWIKLFRRNGFVTTPEPLTFYLLGPNGLSGDAQRMFDSFLLLLDGPLLDGLTGVQRALWRRKLVGFQAFKAALTARAAGDGAREKQFLRQSFAAWPSPVWPPARLKSAAVTFLRR